MTGRLSTAYAGHGDVTEANVDAVLNNFLPPQLGMVYIPTRIPRLQQGLKKAVTWLEGEVGKNGTIPVADLVAALVDRRDREGTDDDPGHDDVTLVMVFDPENEEDVELAKAALAAGIKVVDLASAGDDLLLGDAEIVFEEAEVPADEPEAETPPFDVDEPKATAPAAPEVVDPGKAVADATAAGLAAIAQHLPKPVIPGVSINFTVNLDPDSVTALAQAIVAAMGSQAVALNPAVSAPAGSVQASDGSLPPIGSTGGNPDDPAGQPAGTKVYYYDSQADKYRPARGTARKTEQRVFLTDDQIATIKGRNQLA